MTRRDDHGTDENAALSSVVIMVDRHGDVELTVAVMSIRTKFLLVAAMMNSFIRHPAVMTLKVVNSCE
jgi:hypothetical protein